MVAIFLGSGRVQVHLSDLPSGQEDDRWHQLTLGSSKAARGNVRFSALFKDYVILPVQEYDELKDVNQCHVISVVFHVIHVM